MVTKAITRLEAGLHRRKEVEDKGRQKEADVQAPVSDATSNVAAEKINEAAGKLNEVNGKPVDPLPGFQPAKLGWLGTAIRTRKLFKSKSTSFTRAPDY